MLQKKEPIKQNFVILPMFSTSWGMLGRVGNMLSSTLWLSLFRDKCKLTVHCRWSKGGNSSKKIDLTGVMPELLLAKSLSNQHSSLLYMNSCILSLHEFSLSSSAQEEPGHRLKLYLEAISLLGAKSWELVSSEQWNSIPNHPSLISALKLKVWWKQDTLLPMPPAVPLTHTVHAACRNSWAQEICWGTGFITHFSPDSCLACLCHVNKSLNIE